MSEDRTASGDSASAIPQPATRSTTNVGRLSALAHGSRLQYTAHSRDRDSERNTPGTRAAVVAWASTIPVEVASESTHHDHRNDAGKQKDDCKRVDDRKPAAMRMTGRAEREVA